MKRKLGQKRKIQGPAAVGSITVEEVKTTLLEIERDELKRDVKKLGRSVRKFAGIAGVALPDDLKKLLIKIGCYPKKSAPTPPCA